MAIRVEEEIDLFLRKQSMTASQKASIRALTDSSELGTEAVFDRVAILPSGDLSPANLMAAIDAKLVENGQNATEKIALIFSASLTSGFTIEGIMDSMLDYVTTYPERYANLKKVFIKRIYACTFTKGDLYNLETEDWNVMDNIGSTDLSYEYVTIVCELIRSQAQKTTPHSRNLLLISTLTMQDTTASSSSS